MECSEYEALISAMLDGELSREEESALHTHLKTCERCRNYLALMRAIQGAAEADAPDPPADLSGRIMASVRAAAPQKKKKGRILGIPVRSLALAAAAAVVLLAGWSGSRLLRAKGSAPGETALMSAASVPAVEEPEAPEAGNAPDFGPASQNAAVGENAAMGLLMDAYAERAEEEAAAPTEADEAAPEAVPFTLWAGEEKLSDGQDCGELEMLAILSSYAVPAPERDPDYTLRNERGEILWRLWEDGDRLLLQHEGEIAFGVKPAAVWDILGVKP